jgi:hypothetical protein
MVALGVFAQVGIGNTNPNANALLEIGDATTTTQGLLLPRVDLVSTTSFAPMSANLQGMVVYNKNTAGDVTPGYYYNDGTQWVRLATDAPNNDWGRWGNAGTVAGTNFLGTTDDIALRIKTTSFDRFEVTNGTTQANGGRLRAYTNGDASSPIYSWNANAGTGMFQQAANVIGFSTNAAERFRIPNANQVHAVANGTAALPFYSWASDTDIGMYRIGANNLGFSTNGTERVRISGNGNVGIATGANATERLEVTGNLRLNGAFMPNNQSGGTDKILLSQGAGTAPVWGPGFLNTTQITNIGKFYTGAFSVLSGTILTLTITDPNMTVDTALAYNFVGPLPVGPQYGNNVRLIGESRNGSVVFYITNVSLFDLNNYEIVYTAFYN